MTFVPGRATVLEPDDCPFLMAAVPLRCTGFVDGNPRRLVVPRGGATAGRWTGFGFWTFAPGRTVRGEWKSFGRRWVLLGRWRA
jgi:hypothetical protein